jgi:hypothetical protein
MASVFTIMASCCGLGRDDEHKALDFICEEGSHQRVIGIASVFGSQIIQ